MRLFRRRGERGQGLVEFALISPVFFLIFFSIIEGALMFNAWVSVQHAAGLGARFAVTGRETCASGGGSRAGCIVSEAMAGVKHLSGPSSVTVRSWAYPSYGAESSGPGKQCDAVEVRVNYTYSAKTPMVALILGSVNLNGSQRFLNEPFGTCDT